VQSVLEYYADTRNPQLKNFPDYAARQQMSLELFHTKADGTYRIPALSGPGVVAARVRAGGYLPDESLSAAEAGQIALQSPSYLGNFHAIARVDPQADAGVVKRDLIVDPGQSLACKLIDPAGRPITGVRARGLTPVSYWTQRPLGGAECNLLALHAKKPRWLVVLHLERQLGASVEVSAGEKEPFSIRLGPTGTVTGRLLDPQGQPWKRQGIRVYFEKRGRDYLHQHLPEVISTDDEGRFRIPGVIPGLIYQINVAGRPANLTIGSVATGLSLEAGKTRDLGDVKARMFRD
jgi:hypothetical protein